MFFRPDGPGPEMLSAGLMACAMMTPGPRAHGPQSSGLHPPVLVSPIIRISRISRDFRDFNDFFVIFCDF